MLSPREIEVLRLVGQGLKDREIAERLGLSIHTVRRHVTNARGKLGASNRTQAAVLYFQDPGSAPARSTTASRSRRRRSGRRRDAE